MDEEQEGKQGADGKSADEKKEASQSQQSTLLANEEAVAKLHEQVNNLKVLHCIN